MFQNNIWGADKCYTGDAKWLKDPKKIRKTSKNNNVNTLQEKK